jgi:hypothetical protein
VDDTGQATWREAGKRLIILPIAAVALLAVSFSGEWAPYLFVFGGPLLASLVLWYRGSSMRRIGRLLFFVAAAATAASATLFWTRYGQAPIEEATAYHWIFFYSAHAALVLLPMLPPNFGPAWSRRGKAVMILVLGLLVIPPLWAAGFLAVLLGGLGLGDNYSPSYLQPGAPAAG